MNNQVKLESYDNDWYKHQIGASWLKQVIWYFMNVIFFINPLNPSGKLKCWLLRRFGAVMGKHIIIKPSVNIKYPWKLSIGDHTWIGEKVWIDNLGRVDIGRNVCISQGAMLLTGNHNYKKAAFDLMVQPILLEDGVWIGALSLVCPGVTCKTHAILSASSVANTDLSPYKIYQGNPAKEIRERIIS